tara:strand:- start:14530 stop:15246 length:717 start_codon:yes stop_codon:yes gene_type:complete
MSEYIIEDVIEEFSDEDALAKDVNNHPLAWAFALIVIAPPLIAVLMGHGEGTDAGKKLDSVPESMRTILGMTMDFTLMIQFILAPMLCWYMAQKRMLMPAALIAMAASAVLLSAGNYSSRFDADQSLLGLVASIAATVPFILVLRNKRMQLNPGKERKTWSMLMAISILIFASATIVPATEMFSVNEVCDSDDSDCIGDWKNYSWGSLGIVVIAVGWAWPRGRHIIEEVADDLLESKI